MLEFAPWPMVKRAPPRKNRTPSAHPTKGEKRTKKETAAARGKQTGVGAKGLQKEAHGREERRSLEKAPRGK